MLLSYDPILTCGLLSSSRTLVSLFSILSLAKLSAICVCLCVRTRARLPTYKQDTATSSEMQRQRADWQSWVRRVWVRSQQAQCWVPVLLLELATTCGPLPRLHQQSIGSESAVCVCVCVSFPSNIEIYHNHTGLTAWPDVEQRRESEHFHMGEVMKVQWGVQWSRVPHQHTFPSTFRFRPCPKEWNSSHRTG